MKRTYSLFQKYTAFGLLTGFLLQSCGGLDNSIIPIGRDPQLQTDTQQQLTPQLQTSIQPLMEQTVTAHKGYTATFYKEAGLMEGSNKRKERSEEKLKNSEKEVEEASLNTAIMNSDVQKLQKLVMLGADVNAKMGNGNTPLHLSVLRGNLEVFNFLIHHGANVYLRNNDGNTPLHLAVLKENLGIAKHLVNLEANAIVSTGSYDRVENSLLNAPNTARFVSSGSDQRHAHEMITDENSVKSAASSSGSTEKVPGDVIDYMEHMKEEAIIRSINYTLEASTPNGKWIAKVILDAFKEKKGTLDFGHVTLHERDFSLLSHHPFYTEKARGIKFSNLDNAINRRAIDLFIRQLSQNLQHTNIEEVEIINSNLTAPHVEMFLQNLKDTQVKRINFKYNHVGMVERRTQPFNSTTFVSIMGSNQYLLSNDYLLGTKVEQINLKHNKIELDTQEFLTKKYSHINWLF